MTQRIDTVVIGGSAGSFTALRRLLADLPSDLPAAVLVCQHFSNVGDTHSVDLLSGYSKMPAFWPRTAWRLRQAGSYLPDLTFT